MTQYPVSDQFARRVRWLTIAIIAKLVAWHALSWADRAVGGPEIGNSPRGSGCR
ncbi:MAG: hypothetical protein PHY09_01275 [Desulfuromonadaceae bacterium]|nr:hypothetical protein [Desulfuromonadaceae bacterium]MDD5104947.1 hypothetical protein [Desulfuromonadaceae bacterium]